MLRSYKSDKIEIVADINNFQCNLKLSCTIKYRQLINMMVVATMKK
ncbi:hypothetical protein NTGM5_130123 [Candidatus Nitrotoga sp. M5]|nr:hypothetical protein NTGM5_130123 [Candidatus Nitrotoga sp. M5]